MDLKIKMLKKSKFLLIALLTIIGLLMLQSASLAGDKILYEKSFLANSGEQLDISIIAGKIEVTSWNKNEVSIIVTGDEDVNEYLEFFFEKSGEGVEVKTEKKSSWSGWSNKSKYKVKAIVPQNYDTDLKTSGGDVDVTLLSGKIELTTSGGDISVVDSKGSLSAKTSGGDMESINFVGNSKMKTSGGDIEVKNSNGSIEAKTSGGDIKLITSNGEVMAATSGGDIEVEYTGQNYGIELTTSGGDVELKLPNNFSANLILKTSGGKAKCKYSPVKVEEISKSKFYGKLNNGGEEVICKTSGGNIVVRNK